MALFPAWNGSQGARPPASFACQAFCFVAIRRKRQAVDRLRSAGGSSVAQSFALLWRHVASVLPAQSSRSACGSLWAFGPTAHRAGASLRACRGWGLRPKALCRGIFLLILRAPAGRKKRGFLPKRGFFNGLASLLQETVQALARCGKAASISCFFLFL